MEERLRFVARLLDGEAVTDICRDFVISRKSGYDIQRGRRGHLARQLHALRSRLLRPGAEDLATPRQPVRPEVVTHVLGTFCYPSLRAGHHLSGPDNGIIGALGGIRTPDPQIRSLVLYPAGLRAPRGFYKAPGRDV